MIGKILFNNTYNKVRDISLPDLPKILKNPGNFKE
jgi:hypothetical protein